jgi:hypothetical protein
MKLKSWSLFMPGFVTIIVICGFYGVSAYLIKFPIPTENREILLILIGAIGSKFGDVVAFWINSSMGSHNKDKAAQNVQPNSP